MQYIVLDMEWNQPWPGSYAAQKVLPVQIHGEIIQIGAVRLLETGKIADEFQVLVRPKYYKKLNSRVSKLTGLRDARLREEGLSFPEALERFRDWIGGPCIFLTWGFDDITVLEDNILLHDGEPDWITQWYNAQMIFNAQTGCGNTQKALSTAMELLGIEPSRPAHDALGDAYNTAIEQLDSLAKQYQGQVDAKFAEVETLYNNYQYQKASLSSAARQARENEILAKEKEAQQYQESLFGKEGTLMKQRIEMISPIQKEVFARIEAYAKEVGADLVLDSSNNPTLLYNNPSVERTQQVIDLLKQKK